MESYRDWKISNKLKEFTEEANIEDWYKENLRPLTEASSNSRYSVEVNYRTKIKEMLEGFAKICLGYVSAGMKQSGYHVKHVYEEKPLRILVSSRNWDDGEWVGIVYFHPDHDGGSFVISKGFYNKDVKSVSMQSRQKCKGNSAAEITAELRNLMHSLKGKPDRHVEKLKGVPLKRGPKG
jgi:hypothetical protein